MRVLASASLLGIWSSCACSPSAFTCQDDSACHSGSGPGVCQGDGFCSFPDDACPSGQRYGAHAGDGKANECVPQDGEPTSVADTGSPTQTTSSDDATTTSPATTSPVSASSSTDVATTDATTDAPTTDESTSATAETTGSSGDESTGAPPLDCSLADDFEDDAIDPSVWGFWGGDEGVTVVETEGVVRFTIAAGNAGLGGLITVPPISVAESMVTFTVGAPPDPSTTVEQSLIVQGDGASVRVVLNDGVVIVIVLVGADSLQPYNAAHDVMPGDRFRFTFSDQDVAIEMSLDEATWSPLYSGESPFDPADAEVVARALAYEALDRPSSCEVEAISVCAR